MSTSSDGTALLAAFARLATAAAAPDAPLEPLLEAAAMGIALAELGLLDRAGDRDRVASKARRALLGAGALREAAADEDARDALDLALDQARRGASLLGGGALSSLDGAPTHEPTAHELARLLQGELDGHAAADVALRLHRSGARDRYAAFLPSGLAETRVRLAADSAPVVRDPAEGRSLGTTRLGDAALEGFGFEPGVIAIYAEPAVALSMVSSTSPNGTGASRTVEAAGYLEMAVDPTIEELTLVLADGDRSVRWTLRITPAQMPAR
jgi:hypothetical protein